MAEPIGFLGLGAMGGRMAARLVTAGHDLVVWSRNPARADEVVAAGARRAASPADLAAQCGVVLSCLLDDAAVTAVFDDSRVVASARPGQVFVEHGTVSPALIRRLAAQAAARGAAVIDAPVTGGPEGAARGQLVAMAGGDRDALDRVAGVIGAYAREVAYVGASGAGLQLKLVNQLLVSAHLVATAEAAALLSALGIPSDVATPVLQGGWAASAMLGRELPLALAGDFADRGATIGGLIQVQELVAEAYAQAELRPRLLPVLRELFAESVADGHGADDPAALLALYRQEPVHG